MAGCNNSISYYTRQRISHLVNVIMLVVVLTLLIVPVYILYHVTDTETNKPGVEGICIGVLVIFTLVFSAGVRLFSSESSPFGLLHFFIEKGKKHRGRYYCRADLLTSS